MSPINKIVSMKTFSFNTKRIQLTGFEEFHKLCKRADEILNKLPSYDFTPNESIQQEEINNITVEIFNIQAKFKEINLKIIPHFEEILR